MLRPINDDNSATNPNWRDLEKLLDETSRLSLTAETSEEFHATLLSNLAQVLIASGAAIWTVTSGRFSLAASIGELAEDYSDSSARQRHSAWLGNEVVLNRSEPVELRLGSDAGESVGSDRTLSAMATIVSDDVFAVLEVVTTNGPNSVAPALRSNVLAAFAEILADFHRHRLLGQLHTEVQRWKRTSDVLLQLHRRLDKRGTCHEVANELRQAANCDRVILLCKGHSRMRVEAISNLPAVDIRSSIVREAERLAAAVGDEEGSIWYAEGDGTSQDNQFWLCSYLDVSHSRALAVIPLRITNDAQHSSRLIGMAICERFEQRAFKQTVRLDIELFSRHAAVAIARALELEQLPLIRLARGLGRMRKFASPISRGGAAITSLVATAILIVAAMWPVDFTIRAEGTLQPAKRRDIFAPADGVVRELHVKQGERVSEGQPLLIIQNDELELEVTRIFGELQTARRQLQAVQTSRLEAVTPESQAEDSRGQMTADEEQLKEVIRGLEAQHEHRRKQQDQLTLRSPIRGEIVTWDIERLLRSRPLKRGQRLLTVADVGGDWVLEMHVSNGDVGHVYEALKQDASRLPVSFRVAAEPGRVRSAKLAQVADWTETVGARRPAVRMTAEISDMHDIAAHPGATTSARIFLGQRPRGYVWFREAYEFVRVRFWF